LLEAENLVTSFRRGGRHQACRPLPSQPRGTLVLATTRRNQSKQLRRRADQPSFTTTTLLQLLSKS
jgi:hypothetical protein